MIITHQNIGQVVLAVFRSMNLRLPVHRQSVVVVLGVPLLANGKSLNIMLKGDYFNKSVFRNL